MRRQSQITSCITGGKYKGQKLELSVDSNVRPTKNRVLQAGFNMLGSRLVWDKVKMLDVCCGSGQWGIEALSRGIKHVTFVDLETDIVEKNLKTIGIDKPDYEVFQKSIIGFNPLDSVDLIVADPPYDEVEIYENILNQSWGKSGTLWLLECRKTTDIIVPKWLEEEKFANYGKSSLTLLRQL